MFINPIYNLVSKKLEQNTALVKAQSLVNEDKFDKEKAKDFKAEPGQAFGVLYIPKFKKEIPIIEGVTSNDLDIGIGHISYSKYPLQNDQIYLAIHREKIFREIQDLKPGDELYVEMPYGKVKYIISHTKIVKPEDTQVIKSTYPQEELIIQTCYPFNYIGNAPERYLVYAYPSLKNNL